ncbi:MAG: DNA polymerase III subunit beta [Acidobacteriaceae bacterium]
MKSQSAPPAKASISTKNLQHALKLVSGIAERATTIPVLQALRLEQRSEGLAAEATNLDLSIRVLLGQESGLTAPIITPAHKLAAWAKLLTADDVAISATDARMTVCCGRARAVLPLMSAGLWPELKFAVEGAELTLGVEELSRALGFAILATSVEESRYTLNTVLLAGDGQHLRLVATNGHTLLVYTLPNKATINEMLPRGMVKALLPLLAEAQGVGLEFGADAILATLPGDAPVFLSSRRITGRFPQWQPVLPKAEDRMAIALKAGDLLRSLERCALLSPVESSAVRFEFSADELKMTSANAEAGEAEEVLSCAGPKQPIRISLNADYVLEFMKKLPADGEITVLPPPDATQAMLFQASPAKEECVDYVVMPMRNA